MWRISFRLIYSFQFFFKLGGNYKKWYLERGNFYVFFVVDEFLWIFLTIINWQFVALDDLSCDVFTQLFIQLVVASLCEVHNPLVCEIHDGIFVVFDVIPGDMIHVQIQNANFTIETGHHGVGFFELIAQFAFFVFVVFKIEVVVVDGPFASFKILVNFDESVEFALSHGWGDCHNCTCVEWMGGGKVPYIILERIYFNFFKRQRHKKKDLFFVVFLDR